MGREPDPLTRTLLRRNTDTSSSTHEVNTTVANILRDWVKKARECKPLQSATSAAAHCNGSLMSSLGSEAVVPGDPCETTRRRREMTAFSAVRSAACPACCNCSGQLRVNHVEWAPCGARLLHPRQRTPGRAMSDSVQGQKQSFVQSIACWSRVSLDPTSGSQRRFDVLARRPHRKSRLSVKSRHRCSSANGNA